MKRKNLWIPNNKIIMNAEEGLSPKHTVQAQDSLLAQCSMHSKRYWCLMSLTSFSLSLGNKKRLFINYISQIRKIKYQGNFMAFVEKKVPCISGEKHELQTARHSGNTTPPHIKSGGTGNSEHLNHSKKNHPWTNTWLHRWTSKEGGIQEPKKKQELCKTFNCEVSAEEIKWVTRSSSSKDPCIAALSNQPGEIMKQRSKKAAGLECTDQNVIWNIQPTNSGTAL